MAANDLNRHQPDGYQSDAVTEHKVLRQRRAHSVSAHTAHEDALSARLRRSLLGSPMPPALEILKNGHRHTLRRAKIDKGTLFGLRRTEEAHTVLSNAEDVALIEEMRARRASPEKYVPREHDEDTESIISEPAITNPAIDRPQLELITRLTQLMAAQKPERGAVTLSSAYGTPQGVCGRGAYGVVRIVCKQSGERYAVKEIRKRAKEDAEAFSRRLISEFVILLSLNHCNIVKIYDLMRSSKGAYAEVLEYCSAGDLFTLILESKGKGLCSIEADCFFKQVLEGVIFMHSKGIAHCDLKPENVLLTEDGWCKITDFGASQVFRTAWEDDIHFSSGVVGSRPYAAPEVYLEEEYDPRLADVWSLGVMYVTMRTGCRMWESAEKGDQQYEEFLEDRPTEVGEEGCFGPIERLGDQRKGVIYDMLEPFAEDRATTLDVAASAWIEGVVGCMR